MEDFLIGGFYGLVLGGLCGALISNHETTNVVRQEAISCGAATYVQVGDKIEFKWNEKND